MRLQEVRIYVTFYLSLRYLAIHLVFIIIITCRPVDVSELTFDDLECVDELEEECDEEEVG